MMKYEPKGLWQASVEVMVGPGLSSEPAEMIEVVEAMKAAGYDTSGIEKVDPVGYDYLYLIPLTRKQARDLQKKGSLDFSLEIPEAARDTTVPKPEFATMVVFHLEMP